MLNFQIATEEEQCRTTIAALEHELDGYAAAGKAERAEAVGQQLDIVEERLAELVGPAEAVVDPAGDDGDKSDSGSGDGGDGNKSDATDPSDQPVDPGGDDGDKSDSGSGDGEKKAAKKGGVFGKKK